MKKTFIRFLKNEDGQALSEYALILALIAVVVVGAIAAFGGKIKEIFESVTASLGTTET